MLVLGALWTVLDGSRHFQYVLFERDRCSIVLRGAFRCEALSNVIAVTCRHSRLAKTAQSLKPVRFLMQKAIRGWIETLVQAEFRPFFFVSGSRSNASADRKRRGRSIYHSFARRFLIGSTLKPSTSSVPSLAPC